MASENASAGRQVSFAIFSFRGLKQQRVRDIWTMDGVKASSLTVTRASIHISSPVEVVDWIRSQTCVEEPLAGFHLI